MPLKLLRGTLDLMVLQTLTTGGAEHGYGIARRIERLSRNEVRLNQGTIHAALVRLQKKGSLDTKWGASEKNRRAKFYTISRRGQKQLAQDTTYWRSLSAVMENVLATETEKQNEILKRPVR
jgi:transcriptional regulator